MSSTNILRLTEFTFFSSFSSSAGAGKHWIGIHRNSEEETEYFDSLGINVEFIREKLPKYSKLAVGNLSQLQPSTSDLCGQFVSVFLMYRLANLDLSFEDNINALFTCDLENNEKIVLNHMRNDILNPRS